jgi:RHS repeat-associated protein
MGAELFAEFYTPFGMQPTQGWFGNTGSGLYGSGGLNAGNGSNAGVTGFTDHTFEAETGLTYMQARPYDPVAGRFLSVDPVTFMQDGRTGMFNRYSYTLNDPVNMVDPDGRRGQPPGPAEKDLAGKAALAIKGVGFGLAIALESIHPSISVQKPDVGYLHANDRQVFFTGAALPLTTSVIGPGDEAMAASAAGAGVAKGLGKPALKQASKWQLGSHHSTTKWTNQMQGRGWTNSQIDDAINSGQQFSAANNVNPGNGATRYVNPDTGRSVVRDDTTNDILHLGGDNFKYD